MDLVMRLALASLLLSASLAAAQPRSLQVSPAGSRVLINKDVGEERWAITYDLRDDTVTGAVYFQDGRAPAFFDCTNTTPLDPDSVELACLVSTSGCGAATPTTATCPQPGDWLPTEPVRLPRSFFGLGVAVRIESFDSDEGWVATGNGTRKLGVDAATKREGTGSLRWEHTVNERISKTFAMPHDLSGAAELRLWILANRKAGSACCGFTIRLLSSSGFFERKVLPDLPAGVWTEDVSERDAWSASPFGDPRWSDIRGLEVAFFGSSQTTVLHLDDFRWSRTSSTSPDARANARSAAAPPPTGSALFAWADAANAAGDDDAYASVALPQPSMPGFVSSTKLRAGDFDLRVPRGAVVTGIRVEVKLMKLGDLVWDSDVLLVKDGVEVGASRSFEDDLPDTPAYRYYGGPNDLWGTAWTADDLSAPGFAVSFAVTTHSGPSTALVDNVRVGVYYELP